MRVKSKVKRIRTKDATKFADMYPNSDILSKMPDRPITSAELRMSVNCSPSTMLRKLTELYNAGLVDRFRAGIIWVWVKKKENTKSS